MAALYYRSLVRVGHSRGHRGGVETFATTGRHEEGGLILVLSSGFAGVTRCIVSNAIEAVAQVSFASCAGKLTRLLNININNNSGGCHAENRVPRRGFKLLKHCFCIETRYVLGLVRRKCFSVKQWEQ